jgi:hypothetical protein
MDSLRQESDVKTRSYYLIFGQRKSCKDGLVKAQISLDSSLLDNFYPILAKMDSIDTLWFLFILRDKEVNHDK